MDEFKPDDLNLDMGKSDKDLSPTPLEGSSGPETEVSHAPLNLGGENDSSPAPAAKSAPSAKPTSKRAARLQASVTPGDRITGVRIFFTKLHAGALDFLSEQITEWLKNNPNIAVKHTNITVGEIAAKKTEANLIITVWY